jgi:hypothetical protein
MAYLDVLDNNRAGDGVLAVTASTVELAEVRNLETIDGDGSLSVVLDDLVGSRLGASTLDEGVTVTLQGKSVLANVDPPDVLDGAGALAVDTLDPGNRQYAITIRPRTCSLVFANDGVLQCTTVLNHEDGVRVATLSLTSAGNTTAVSLKTTVKSTGDDLGLGELDGALGAGDRDAGALLHGESLSRSGSGRAGGNGGHEGGNGSDDGELHVVGWLVIARNSNGELVGKCVK